jgi:thiamine pyrophosphokinase
MRLQKSVEKFMKIVLLAGGPLSERALLYLQQEDTEVWVGVDSGARHFQKINRLPSVVTGDFDSLTQEEQEHFASQGVKIVPTPDQDYTDMDKALEYVLDNYPVTHIRIYGATGGQTDHFLSVLSALVKYEGRAKMELVDEHGVVWLADRQQELVGEDLVGRLFSLIALGEVTGITTTGLQWPLTNETLIMGVRDGTRNIIIAPKVTVEKQSGCLFLMLHHPV